MCYFMLLEGHSSLVFHEFAVAYALRFFYAETLRLVLLIVGVGAFEEEYLTVALECEDVGADTVEESAVVADYYCATGKHIKTFLKSAECVDVDVVGRLVEEKDVTLLLERKRELQTVTLTT